MTIDERLVYLLQSSKSLEARVQEVRAFVNELSVAVNQTAEAEMPFVTVLELFMKEVSVQLLAIDSQQWCSSATATV